VLPEADRLFDPSVAYESLAIRAGGARCSPIPLCSLCGVAPWKTCKDFVTTQERPGEIPYGSVGPYGTLHVAMEMLAASAGIKLLHVAVSRAGRR